jgi:hypothetical protein
MAMEKSVPATYAGALYPVGAAFVLFPLADLIARLFPLNAGNAQWRFAYIGLAVGSMAILLLGVTILGLVAAIRGNRGVLRGVAILSALWALLLLAALGLFASDAMQVKASLVRPEIIPQFTKMITTAGISGVLYLIGFVGVAVASIRASRTRPVIGTSGVVAPDAPVLVYSGAEK